MFIDAPSVPESTGGTVADNTTTPVIDETPTNSTEPVDDPGTDAPANDTTPEPTPSAPTEPTEPEEPKGPEGPKGPKGPEGGDGT